jgi:hypothetical protein
VNVAIATRRLSELVPEDQAVEVRERIKTPFPGRHQGTPVIVQAVFKRTAIVRESDEHEPYQAHVEDVEVDERDVVVLSADQARRLTPWKRLDGPANPVRARAMRDASDRRAERDRVRVSGSRRRQVSKAGGSGPAAVPPSKTAAALDEARNEAASLAELCAELAGAARELTEGLKGPARVLDAARAREFAPSEGGGW